MYEEDAIIGLESTFSCPIFGGSSGDFTPTDGNWKQICSEDSFSYGKGLAIALCSPTVEVSYSSLIIHSPTRYSGVVTKSIGNRIIEINHQPAAQVYSQWVGEAMGSLQAKKIPVFLRNAGSLYPLGITQSGSKKDPLRLTLVAQILEDHSLLCMNSIREGCHLVLMNLRDKDVENISTKILSTVINASPFSLREVRGGLVMISAGIQALLMGDMDKMAYIISKISGHVPLLGITSFGEQGYCSEGFNEHRLLTISFLFFSNQPKKELPSCKQLDQFLTEEIHIGSAAIA